MKPILVARFMQTGIDQFTAHRRYGTAHVHRCVLHSVMEYSGNPSLCLHELTPDWLKNYETHLLLAKKRSRNTTSTYLRCLQTVYNRALQEGLVPFVPGHFKRIFTGVTHNHSRAMSAEQIRRLINAPLSAGQAAVDQPRSGERQRSTMRARACMELMLRMRGIAFVDLAFLPKTAVQGNHLIIQRRKTGRILRFRITKEIGFLLQKYAHRHVHSPFLLDILHTHDGTDKGIYRSYQRQLRSLNRFLGHLAALQRVGRSVTSYCARHTWATQAKYCGIPTEVISEGLGHASVSTTAAYLKSFEQEVLEEANEVVISNILSQMNDAR
ncbi:MAG: site-specific integrase [Prevotellaceae bacterium]|jgi:integrase|nr:site-specific integrase [Prevotellaceae bacterium]